MNNKYLQIAVVVVLIAVVAVVYFMPNKAQAPTPQSMTPSPTPQTTEVVVDMPLPNTVITSPVMVMGRALGAWYFEANLPVILKDGNGNVIAQKGFQAITDWMVTGFVDFSDTLTFTMPGIQNGTLEIHNDNPSGDPINDKVFTVPVKFW